MIDGREDQGLKIRLLEQRDIEILGDLYFPWSTREATIAKWTHYLDEQKKGDRVACIVEAQGKIMGKVVGKIVGYGSLLFSSQYPHFRDNNIPEIHDVWVYEEHRKQGIATALISYLEQLAKQKEYKTIGMAVGLYRDYGAAQRLYFQMGYQPDGEGVTYKYAAVIPGEQYPVDDDLTLWLQKQLRL